MPKKLQRHSKKQMLYLLDQFPKTVSMKTDTNNFKVGIKRWNKQELFRNGKLALALQTIVKNDVSIMLAISLVISITIL